MIRNNSESVFAIDIARYPTTSGEEAIVTSVGIDGRLHGYVPRHLTATW